MNELEYPFDPQYIMRKRKALKKQLKQSESMIKKKIAVLGGSTTHDVVEMLELFLLNNGIEPEFYESEYAQYWQDSMFDNPKLREFSPDIIYIHTSFRNINSFPEPSDSQDTVEKLISDQYSHFEIMWKTLTAQYSAIIIQNNFELPFYRLMGNRDCYDLHGRVNYVSELNRLFALYARAHENFFINDINYLSSDYGLSKWCDMSAWYMYKYALAIDAIPVLSYSVANIIKSVYGKKKKALAIDLDNTLWGGIVGDDGVENLEIGQETAVGQAYSEFQEYLSELKKYGIILNIISKNERENALAGLGHPQMVLKEDDFISIKANWEPKSVNLANLASELSLLPEGFVFVDDNPAEREIIRQQFPSAAVPEMTQVEEYIMALDKPGYFEITTFSKDDISRNRMYKENLQRSELQNSFSDYKDYLLSLNMCAEIGHFTDVYMSRIAQLTNKSNQFNLTTLRCSQEDIKRMASDTGYITLYGKLSDRFGDNGVVSVVIGRIDGTILDIVLWLMSCRVLKRDMEFAMEDSLVDEAKKRGITRLVGHYYPTAKNAMVKNFYSELGFEKETEDQAGNSSWSLDISDEYSVRNKVINVNGGE